MHLQCNTLTMSMWQNLYFIITLHFFREKSHFGKFNLIIYFLGNKIPGDMYHRGWEIDYKITVLKYIRKYSQSPLHFIQLICRCTDCCRKAH